MLPPWQVMEEKRNRTLGWPHNSSWRCDDGAVVHHVKVRFSEKSGLSINVVFTTTSVKA